MANKIYIPLEIFKKLSKEEADKLQEELMYLYFKSHPEKLNEIIDRSEGDTDLINVYKEQEYNEILSTDYAFDVNILQNRKNDPMAQKLVEVVNEYNDKQNVTEQSTEQVPEQVGSDDAWGHDDEGDSA